LFEGDVNGLVFDAEVTMVSFVGFESEGFALLIMRS